MLYNGWEILEISATRDGNTKDTGNTDAVSLFTNVLFVGTIN